MQFNNLQSNNTHNASFAPNPANANQQGSNPQVSSVPPLADVADLANNPSARNLQTYNTSSTPKEPTDTWDAPEYQPIKLEELGTEKLANEAINTKKLNLCLTNAQGNEELAEFPDAEKAYKKALKYTEKPEHYKLYAGCLKAMSTALQDEVKAKTYKEKAARAFYYLGALYQKQGALQEAQAAYQVSCGLVLYETPLQALVDLARQVGETGGIATALEKLADFYADKRNIDLAIDKLKEAFELEKSAKILEKLEALYSQDSREDSQSKVNELAIQRFELQISQDPKNISLYRKYAWFLKDIGRKSEARAVKERMDGLQALQGELLHKLQQKVVKQKTKIGGLKQQVAHLEKQALSLDLSSQTDIQDADLISIVRKNPYTKFLNLQGCSKITDTGLAALKGLTQLSSLNLSSCTQLTDAGLQHLAGLTELSSLDLSGSWNTTTNFTGAGLQYLADLTQLSSLDLSNSQLTGAGLQYLSGLTQLTSLNLCGGQLTDAGLQHLAGLTQLTSLNLCGGQLTSAGLQHLSGLTQLTSLNLGSWQLTGGGLQHLRGLTQLTSLSLTSFYNLTDTVLQHLSGLTQLRELNLSHSQDFTDAGLQHLAGLTQLSSLELSGCLKITDAGLQHLASLTQLRELNLCNCKHLTDAGLQHLAGLTQLTSLNLYNCYSINDTGLQHLAGLTQLTSLDLHGCQTITSNARAQLKKQIPGLMIIEQLPELTIIDYLE